MSGAAVAEAGVLDPQPTADLAAGHQAG